MTEIEGLIEETTLIIEETIRRIRVDSSCSSRDVRGLINRTVTEALNMVKSCVVLPARTAEPLKLEDDDA